MATTRGLAEAVRMLVIVREDVEGARFDDTTADDERDIIRACADVSSAVAFLSAVLARASESGK